MLRGYQSMYVDEHNEFDEEAILNSPDAADYLLLRDMKTNRIKVVFTRDNNAYN